MDIGIVWHKAYDDRVDTDLRYKPCTRFATLAHLNIPIVAHGGFRCIDDLLGDSGTKKYFTAKSYEGVVQHLLNMERYTSKKIYWDTLAEIKYKTSNTVIMQMYAEFFTRVRK
jgi:hypothetical protein